MSFLTQNCNIVRWNTSSDELEVEAAGLSSPTVYERDDVNDQAWKAIVEGAEIRVPVAQSAVVEAALVTARAELNTRWSQVNSALGVLDGMAGNNWDVAIVATPRAWELKPAGIDTTGRSVAVINGAPNAVAVLVSRL